MPLIRSGYGVVHVHWSNLVRDTPAVATSKPLIAARREIGPENTHNVQTRT
jgi:hypothetical protein